MTTSKPPARAAAAQGGNSAATDRSRRLAPSASPALDASEAAALYRLMTWLSPAFPVGAFSYSSGIEWAVEAGDIADAASLRGLAGGDAGGWIRDFATACSWRMPTARRRGATTMRLAGDRGTRRRLRALARAAAGNHGAGPRLHRHRARGLELRRARADDRGLRRRHRLSRRGRPRQRGACDSASRRRCTPSFTRWRRTGFPPAPGWSRSGRPTASGCWRSSSRSSVATADRAQQAVARRSRQRHLPRRPRQPAARDAIYEVVPVMRMHAVSQRRRPHAALIIGAVDESFYRNCSGYGSRRSPGRRGTRNGSNRTARFASASAVRSDRARPR